MLPMIFTCSCSSVADRAAVVVVVAAAAAAATSAYRAAAAVLLLLMMVLPLLLLSSSCCCAVHTVKLLDCSLILFVNQACWCVVCTPFHRSSSHQLHNVAACDDHVTRPNCSTMEQQILQKS
jgi:hypothetical protein